MMSYYIYYLLFVWFRAKKMSKFITDDIEILSHHSDKEGSDEKNFDEENEIWKKFSEKYKKVARMFNSPKKVSETQ